MILSRSGKIHVKNLACLNAAPAVRTSATTVSVQLDVYYMQGKQYSLHNKVLDQGHPKYALHNIPKIWRELNLADCPQSSVAKILADFNLADATSATGHAHAVIECTLFIDRGVWLEHAHARIRAVSLSCARVSS